MNEDKRVFCPSHIEIHWNDDSDDLYLESRESVAVSDIYGYGKPISGTITEILKTNKVARLREGHLSLCVIEHDLIFEVDNMNVVGMGYEQIKQVILLFLKQEGGNMLKFVRTLSFLKVIWRKHRNATFKKMLQL